MDYLKIINADKRYEIVFTEDGAIYNGKNLGFVFNVKAINEGFIAFTPLGYWKFSGNSATFTKCMGLIDCSSEACAYITKNGILVVPQSGEPYGADSRPLFLIPYTLPMPFFGQLWGSSFISYREYPSEKELPLSNLFAPHRLFKAVPTLYPPSFDDLKGIRSAKIGGALTDSGLVAGSSEVKASGEFIDFARVEGGVLLYGNEQKLIPITANVEEPLDDPIEPDREYCTTSSELALALSTITSVAKSAIRRILARQEFVRAFIIGFGLALGYGIAWNLIHRLSKED